MAAASPEAAHEAEAAALALAALVRLTAHAGKVPTACVAPPPGEVSLGRACCRKTAAACHRDARAEQQDFWYMVALSGVLHINRTHCSEGAWVSQPVWAQSPDACFACEPISRSSKPRGGAAPVQAA